MKLTVELVKRYVAPSITSMFTDDVIEVGIDIDHHVHEGIEPATAAEVYDRAMSVGDFLRRMIPR